MEDGLGSRAVVIWTVVVILSWEASVGYSSNYEMSEAGCSTFLHSSYEALFLGVVFIAFC